MNVIDLFNNDVSGYKEKTKIILNDKKKGYRTLYFDNLVDVRLCNKNGNTSLRKVWSQLYKGDETGCSRETRKYFYEMYLKKGFIESNEYMFRKNSYRIAVKRDPIERAISAAKHLCKIRLCLEPNISLIEDILSIASPTIDYHFLSQTHWMGNINLYHNVYDLQDLNSMVEWIENDSKYQYPLKIKKYNISDSTIGKNDISNNIIKMLYKMYEIDYDNGWY
jgi:hypothetical protein